MAARDYVGTTWDSKDGKRALFVKHEASPFRGERVMIANNVETGRSTTITLSGLLRKYRQREES